MRGRIRAHLTYANVVARVTRPRALHNPGKLLLLVGLVALTAAPTSASGQTRIVWSRFEATADRLQLVSAPPDGSQLVELTHPRKNHTQDIDASISPDGSQIAFERDFPDHFRTVLMDADGTNQQSPDLGCTDPCIGDSAPTWNETGNRLAFTPVVGPFNGPNGSAASAVLYTAHTDGSDLQRLSEPGIDGTFEDYSAQFAPDGSYIVFNRLNNFADTIAVYRMDPDGSNVRRLTPFGLSADTLDLSPATSGPTKDLVAFETYGHNPPPEGRSSNVATVPSTCAPVSTCRKQIEYLTHHHHVASESFNPAWSPNGARIAFTKFRGGQHDCCVGDIWTMRANGSDKTPVSTSPLFEFRPDWGPAG